MIVEQTTIPGVALIRPDCFRDERGFFLETYRRDRYHEIGFDDDFCQDNHSRSLAGVLRGLHYQIRRPQAQIVTLLRGRVFDVTVDLRRGSTSYGRWFGTVLTDDDPCQVYMAAGIAHGFCVLSDVADIHYKVSRFYDGNDDGGLLWNDADLAIRWPIERPRVSARDAGFPRLRDLDADRLPHLPPLEAR